MRLILADDHPIVLGGLDKLFSSTPDFDVVARCQTGGQAITVTTHLMPHVLLLDLRLPDMSGIDVLRAVKRDVPATRVVILSAVSMPHDTKAARELGADGLLYKDLAPDDLVNEVRRAVAGLRPFPADAPGDVSLAQSRLTSLTAREREILMGAVQGARSRALARDFGITEATVKLHLHNIYEKLGVSSRVELMVLAQRIGVSGP